MLRIRAESSLKFYGKILKFVSFFGSPSEKQLSPLITAVFPADAGIYPALRRHNNYHPKWLKNRDSFYTK